MQEFAVNFLFSNSPHSLNFEKQSEQGPFKYFSSLRNRRLPGLCPQDSANLSPLALRVWKLFFLEKLQVFFLAVSSVLDSTFTGSGLDSSLSGE